MPYYHFTPRREPMITEGALDECARHILLALEALARAERDDPETAGAAIVLMLRQWLEGQAIDVEGAADDGDADLPY